MKHWKVKMIETTHYKEGDISNPLYVTIRAKDKPNINAWIKRNNNRFTTYEFVEIVSWGYTDRKNDFWEVK